MYQVNKTKKKEIQVCSDTWWEPHFPSALSPLTERRLPEGKSHSGGIQYLAACGTEPKHAMGQGFSLYSVNILHSCTFS